MQTFWRWFYWHWGGGLFLRYSQKFRGITKESQGCSPTSAVPTRLILTDSALFSKPLKDVSKLDPTLLLCFSKMLGTEMNVVFMRGQNIITHYGFNFLHTSLGKIDRS
jgi:hypothetical protein